MPIPLSIKLLTIPSLLAASTLFTIHYLNRCFLPPFRIIYTSTSSPSSSTPHPFTSTSALSSSNNPRATALLASPSMRIVNPLQHQTVSETHFTEARLSDLGGKAKGGAVDEARGRMILEQFVWGFFEGWGFWGESVVLKGLRTMRGVKESPHPFIDVDLITTSSHQILWHGQNPCFPFAQVGYLLHGVFEVINISITSPSSTSLQQSMTSLEDVDKLGLQISQQTRTCICDVAFQTSPNFAGCHRFEVSIPDVDSTKGGSGLQDQRKVQLSITSAVCNPSVDRTPTAVMWGFYWVHVWYKNILFGDAVRSAFGLRGCE